MKPREKVDLLREEVKLLKAKQKLLLAIKELEGTQRTIPYIPMPEPWPWSIPTITWKVGAGDPLPPLPVTTCSVDARTLANVPMTFATN